MTSKPKLDRLFEVFAGEIVSIMLNKDVEQTRQTETKIETLRSSIVVNGYLVDMDDDYVYLGLESDIINQAVKRAFIVHMEIVDNLDEIIDITVPATNKGYN